MSGLRCLASETMYKPKHLYELHGLITPHQDVISMQYKENGHWEHSCLVPTGITRDSTSATYSELYRFIRIRREGDTLESTGDEVVLSDATPIRGAELVGCDRRGTLEALLPPKTITFQRTPL